MRSLALFAWCMFPFLTSLRASSNPDVLDVVLFIVHPNFFAKSLSKDKSIFGIVMEVVSVDVFISLRFNVSYCKNKYYFRK